MNFLFRREGSLDSIFSPRRIAVIGATETEGSVGKTVMSNLLAAGFQGEIFPINPKRPTVLGLKAYPHIKDCPKLPDLAVVVTPAKVVPQIISECSDLKIPAAVIISAGFKEMGAPGIELERQILVAAKRSSMRVIGPNCLGIMRPSSSLNATFAAGMALKGKIAFISQSGALCTAVLDWSLHEKVGFSAFVSIGSMIDVDWGDLIDYFGSDPLTQSILIYMESVGNARAFLSAAREAALSKPIILIKAGRSAESAKAAASHTGALAGSDEAFSAALRRVGVLRVDTIADLFGMADLLAKQPRPKGPRLTIVTNAGGPGVIATDALIRYGGQLTQLNAASLDQYSAFLPEQWSHNNPIDVLGDADAKKYAKAVAIAAKDPNADGVLVILTPQDMTDPTATAQELVPYAHSDKPLLASWMGMDSVEEGNQILSRSGIPTFAYPDLACKAFAQMWRSAYNLLGIYEVSELPLEDAAEVVSRDLAAQILKQARLENREILDEVESKKILQIYKIPTVPTEVAKDAEEAVRLAEKMGYPIVLKLYSRTITHKTDVGGVKLHLTTREAVLRAFAEIQSSVKKLKGAEHFQGVTVQPMIKLSDAYELILGSSLDEQFGPIMLFGCGGQLVEVFQDRSLALPPLTTTLARRMMEQTKIYHALQGVRGRASIDMRQLERILVRFSQLIVEQPWIKECDINPLLASPSGLLALDARIILHPATTSEDALPTSAIRPYPGQFVEEWRLSDDTPITLRPSRPEDEPLMVQFHQDLSQETVRQRYLKVVHYDARIAHERLSRICFNDYDREIAILALKGKEILAVIRLSKVSGTKDAVFALMVKDRWQKRGIGTKLMQKIIQIAKQEKLEHLAAQMLSENIHMQKMCRSLGFSLQQKAGQVLVVLDING